MMTWSAFAEGITRATTSITDSAHLLRKLNFPAVVLPASMVISAMVNQGFRLLILLFGIVFLGDGISWHILLVPVVLLVP